MPAKKRTPSRSPRRSNRTPQAVGLLGIALGLFNWAARLSSQQILNVLLASIVIGVAFGFTHGLPWAVQQGRELHKEGTDAIGASVEHVTKQFDKLLAEQNKNHAELREINKAAWVRVGEVRELGVEIKKQTAAAEHGAKAIDMFLAEVRRERDWPKVAKPAKEGP